MISGIPQIEVGILFAPSIHFRLNAEYRLGREIISGEFTVNRKDGKYFLSHEGQTQEIRLPLQLTPRDFTGGDFDLMDVTIGLNFHWERKEDQKFKGSLKIIDEGDYLTAVNILSLEDYLLSVISSEMKATASLELLKAHAVISRSWLLAQREKASKLKGGYRSEIRTPDEYIRWFDREDHVHFDVCADDHCQRYQGISKAYTPQVGEAVEATRGEVLIYKSQICDARFSKCCGGVSEKFENTWENVEHPYLDRVTDTDNGLETGDLTDEEEARRWILSKPAVFCNTDDEETLAEILNEYDLETRHFFRWKITYTRQELSRLASGKLDTDFGLIQDIIPVERGVSGRLIKVRIVGTKCSLTIGKELMIRKAFSPTHLYSSAFIVEQEGDDITFHGAGWGHGVGLCQIGAAVMARKGYNYRQILKHYFKGSEILKLYE